MPTGLGSPGPVAVAPTCRLLSVLGSVIGPDGPSTVSLTAIRAPGLTLGVAVMIARTAPCQKTVALTSWLARPGGAVSFTCQVPTSAAVMSGRCSTSTGELPSAPLIAVVSVQAEPSGMTKDAVRAGLTRSTLIA